MEMRKFLTWVSKVYVVVGFVFILGALGLVLTPVVPYIAYRLNPEETNNEVQKISDTDLSTTETRTVPADYIPPLDLSLPEDPYIRIPKIKVDSPISTLTNFTEALKNGAWVVPDFGTPENGITPIIIASHRFGYIYWDAPTRERISFYNLPKTHAGDLIEIIWGQRKYTYEIYAESEGSRIADYSSDLVLYTCKYFNSPTRIFRYARLLNP